MKEDLLLSLTVDRTILIFARVSPVHLAQWHGPVINVRAGRPMLPGRPTWICVWRCYQTIYNFTTNFPWQWVIYGSYISACGGWGGWRLHLYWREEGDDVCMISTVLYLYSQGAFYMYWRGFGEMTCTVLVREEVMISVLYWVGDWCMYMLYLNRQRGDVYNVLVLKVHLHEIFDFWFFSSKVSTWSPDSHPKFVSNIKSNSPRYSKYLTLRVDSVNVE
jgi:hypothetical protein